MQPQISQEQQRTIPEMICRGFWMMFGPLLLVPITFKIIEHGQGWFTAFDLTYFVIVVAMLAARGFEFYKGAPRTSEGQPATPEHYKRYAIGVVAVSIPCWIFANLLGNYWQ